MKEKIETIVKKVMSDKDFAKNFEKNPAKCIEELLGVKLPEEQVNDVVKAVKAKATAENMGKLLDSDGDGKPDLGGIGKLGGLFGKKE